MTQDERDARGGNPPPGARKGPAKRRGRQGKSPTRRRRRQAARAGQLAPERQRLRSHPAPRISGDALRLTVTRACDSASLFTIGNAIFPIVFFALRPAVRRSGNTFAATIASWPLVRLRRAMLRERMNAV
jgi:hypothetical protein